MSLKGDLNSKKKNLIFFYPSLEIGGLTKNLFSLINSLSRKNYKITFVTFDKISENKVGSKLYKFDKNIEVVTP